MIRIIQESKQDRENLLQAVTLMCEWFGEREISPKEFVEKYLKLKDAVKRDYPEYVDMTNLTRDINTCNSATPENYSEKLELKLFKFYSFVKKYKSRSEMKQGTKLIGEKNGWKVYYISSVESAQIMGKGTTWCITGRYEGHESEAEKWFNSYKTRNGIDGYYFVINDKFDANNPQSMSDYKWCVLKTAHLHPGILWTLETYNADQSKTYEGLVNCFCSVPHDFPWELIVDQDWLVDVGEIDLHDSNEISENAAFQQIMPDFLLEKMPIKKLIEAGIIKSEIIDFILKDYQSWIEEKFYVHEPQIVEKIKQEYNCDEPEVYDILDSMYKEVSRNYKFGNKPSLNMKKLYAYAGEKIPTTVDEVLDDYKSIRFKGGRAMYFYRLVLKEYITDKTLNKVNELHKSLVLNKIYNLTDIDFR